MEIHARRPFRARSPSSALEQVIIGNATALRHHFRLWRGTTPNAYRRLFRGDPG